MTEEPVADPVTAARRARTIHRGVIFALQGVMAVGIVGAMWEGQWLAAITSAGIVGLSLAPLLVRRGLDVFVPPELELPAVLFVFASLYLGEVSGYYDHYWWWDVALHTASGLLLGLFGFLLVYVLNQSERIDLSLKPAFLAVFAFSFAVAGGALWEIFEFALDELVGMAMQHGSLRDTMADLIVDTIGAAAVSLVSYGYIRRRSEYFVLRWIRRFVEANPRLFR